MLIADDHPAIVRGVREILEDAFDLQVADEASRSDEAVAFVLENDYDIIIQDMSLPEEGSVAVLKQIKASKPDLAVLIYSLYPEEQYGVQAINSGAAGYLNKNAAPDTLGTAIRVILHGEQNISPALKMWLEQ